MQSADIIGAVAIRCPVNHNGIIKGRQRILRIRRIRHR